MGKQLLIVLGGGRPRGNTAQLVEAFTRGADQIGRTNHLERAFTFGQTLYPPEALA